MTDPDSDSASRLQKRELELRWYQARLGFWQAIWGTLITGGIAVAIPAGVEAYKISQENALKQKELEGKFLDAEQRYVSSFLSNAVDPDIQQRIRFSQYFAFVLAEPRREGWDKFRVALEKRRSEVRAEINLREAKVEKLRAKQGSLSLEEESEQRKLQRELRWLYSELGEGSKEFDGSADETPRPAVAR
jgi:hypothetical protein